MNVPAGKILKRVSDLDLTISNEQVQFLQKGAQREDKGMWRAEEEDPLSVPSAELTGVFQPKSEHKSGLKIQKRTQGFGPKSKVT